MNKIVSNLGCDHDFIPLVRERFRDQLFAQTVAIGISRIEQGDAEIERSLHERNRFAFGKISPPAGGNRPQTKADLANRQISVFVSAKLHRLSLNARCSTLNAQLNSTLNVGR